MTKEMSLESFFSLGEAAQNLLTAPSAKKSGKLIGRKFNIIAYRNGETKTVENVGRNTALKLKAELKLDGYNRVDMIEIHDFDNQTFEAANNKFQPVNLPEDEKPRQRTIAWEYFGEKLDNVWLDNRPVTKVADRAAKRKAEQKRIEIFNRINAKNASPEKMKIFNRINGNFLYSAVEEEDIVNFMKVNNLTLDEVILYVPTETYQMLKGME